MHFRTALMTTALSALLLVASTAAAMPQRNNDSWQASGESGALVTGSREAADAGLAMLQAGGNAVDAAVTTMLVQSVVESGLFCFGSEVPILVYDARRGVVEVVAGLGRAPRLATVEWFEANRKGVIEGRGDPANCVVPGFLDACLAALDRYGTRTFGECAQPMLQVLRDRAAATPENVREKMGSRPSIADPDRWLEHHRNFLALIERLVAAETAGGSDRARGLRMVADCFYRGPVARELDAWSRESGGLLRFSDLASHRARIEDPVTVEFAGHTICKCGPWTQGPFLLQTVKLLEPMGLQELDPGSADYVHQFVEAMKLCLADRDAWFGDPEFVDVPLAGLLSGPYLDLRRPLIVNDQASSVQQPGDPVGLQPLSGLAPRDHKITSGFSSDTSNCLVADAAGNVVAATPSGWGGVIAGNTGIELGSRMIGLTCWEDHPSQLVPGKHPRITLTPTMVLKEGKPVCCISVAGGDQQDQASLQVLLNHLWFGMDAARAVRQPRFGTDHHINWFGHLPVRPASLTIANSFGETTIGELRRRGHAVTVGRPAATAVILTIDPGTGQKQAAGDPGRHARGY